MEVLGVLFLILITSLIMGRLSTAIGLPNVVGQILAGIILGPAILNIVHSNELITVSSELGVILLMFMAGLECDINKLKKYLKPSFLVAIMGILIPMITFSLYGVILKQDFKNAIFLGIIFSATSVSITVEVLKEYKKLDSLAGSIIIGSAIIDDVLSIIILSFFTSLTSESGNNLLINSIFQISYFILIYILVKWLGNLIIKYSKKAFNIEAMPIIVISLSIGMAYLAELAHLSTVLGAFFAGLSLAQNNNKKEINSIVSYVGYSTFIPIFFVSIGLGIKFNGILDNLSILIVITILALLTKWLGSFIGAKAYKVSTNDSNIVGFGMISRGEMSLIIAQIGISANLISTNLYSIIILSIVLTTIIAPIMIKLGLKK
ncbi:cation:proton antiporter [Apilactobacillus micheneri]|uniref:Cation:proton antiporter n=1 Tax=Apilactobacillus micheneri TaxID=1899430 RepID=A0ABY2YZD4_9LACO|nr:cation:proton antiporter [Apilactobacillus micheneri]TPR26475.1 cation:proton antiporter [Apilactobacillus micheneri]TPR27229.1 cation:proton antiporter [Apilactobacillus micheneri]TPR27476.1 cation:proton antiporter [Apilactobacillus micheneri]TPR31992.1 cation:proton antiporter [Apilactobacillus micheneri]TPR32396.1 cation:proton antiporter [Apilactobacillus micheneri]